MTTPINKITANPLLSTVDPLLIQTVIINAKIDAIIKFLVEAKLTTIIEVQKEVDMGLNEFLNKFSEVTDALTKINKEKPKVDLSSFNEPIDPKKIH